MRDAARPRPDLCQLTMPSHAINGKRYRTNVEAFRRHAPQHQVSHLPGTGHYLILEAPLRFNQLLDAALAEMAPAPAPRPAGNRS